MKYSPWLRRVFAAAAFLGVAHMPENLNGRPEAKTFVPHEVIVPRIQLTASLPDNITCNVLPQHTRLGYTLPRLARKLDAGLPVVIVAVGSSSTEGVGASSVFSSYPARLQGELRRMFQSDAITVINHGVGGEKASDMLARLSRVTDENPDLVIFQGDVNSVLANAPLEPARDAMDRVITTLRAQNIDVVLMDAQFAPRVNDMPDAARMQGVMAQLGQAHRIGLFQRHDLMRHWHEKEGLRYEQFLSPDNLHMKDWSYACTARVLAHAIGNAVYPRIMYSKPVFPPFA
jgi:lysophospholipase L1-like esterase